MITKERIFMRYRSFFDSLFSFVFLSAGSAGLLGFKGRKRGQVDLLLR